MTRFEISGTVVSVVFDDFYVSTKSEDGGSVFRVPVRPDQDKPKEGDKVTVAVEVYS